jgi:RAP1 GTPase activating protein 1
VNLLIEETVDRDVLYYRSYFAGRPHDNYVSPVDTELGPVVLTVDGEGVAITATSRVYKVLVRTKRGDRRYSLTSAKARGERLKEIRVKCGLGDLPLQRVRDGAIEKRLIDFERKLQVTRYKFGVLRVGAGQTGEDEIYANTGMPAPFERFLDVLGERIALLGFDGYTGGLNTRDGSTGVSSVYTKFQNFEVMFHVAPLLPFFEDDKQQVERKRHLGNDVVLVIFLDSDAAAFDPRILTSHFNSAFVVVRPVANAADQYDVAVVYKSDVRPVRPFWSSSRLSGTRDEMHTLLLTKLVNLERAAMSSGEFIGLDLRTRNLMLSDICTTFDSK